MTHKQRTRAARIGRPRQTSTVEHRILLFLQDAYRQMKKTDFPRMQYTAMGHHLSCGAIIGAAQRLRIMDRDGHRWSWRGQPPSQRMAKRVREEALDIQRLYSATYAAKQKGR